MDSERKAQLALHTDLLMFRGKKRAYHQITIWDFRTRAEKYVFKIAKWPAEAETNQWWRNAKTRNMLNTRDHKKVRIIANLRKSGFSVVNFDSFRDILSYGS